MNARAAHPPRGVAAVGALATDLFQSSRALYGLFLRTLYWLFRGRREKRAVLTQMFRIGNRSAFFILVTMGFIGMIFIFQGALQAKRILPDMTRLGATFLEILIRDLGASIGAMMLATRVGAGIAAEIGSMVVTEQVDALRMCAADPIDYLVVPRFVASAVMTVVLIVLSCAIAATTGMLTAWFLFDVQPHVFFDLQLVDAADVTIGLAKAVAYGIAIPIVSAHSGLSTFGGSEGVGWATTRAVVNSSIAVLVLNLLISSTGYLLLG